MYDISLSKGSLNYEESITEALNNLFTTKKGSIPHNRAFGTNIEKYLFEVNSNLASRLITKDIQYTFSKFLHPLQPKEVSVQIIEDGGVKTLETSITVVINNKDKTLKLKNQYKRG